MLVLAEIALKANAGPFKFPQVVFKRDVKASIVTNFDVESLTKLVGPQIRVVRPVTFPFTLAPRVAQLNEPHLSPAVPKFKDLNQRISMA
jgi:hypothetical protein